MRTRYQVDRQAAAVALKTGMPTPGHAAAEAGLAADEAGHEAGHEDPPRRVTRRTVPVTRRPGGRCPFPRRLWRPAWSPGRSSPMAGPGPARRRPADGYRGR